MLLLQLPQKAQEDDNWEEPFSFMLQQQQQQKQQQQ